jgi:hypothetical protein
LKITPVKSYSVQIFEGYNGQLTFEKSNSFQKRQNKNYTQFNIKLNKEGKVFVAKDLSEDLYNMFLSKITNGEIVDTIEDLVKLFSDLH